MPHILIMGATGGIGGHAMRQALDHGQKVRAFARSAEHIRLSHANLETRKGDALDAADVAAAVDGIDVVIQALGVAPGPDMILKPIHLFSEATRILLPAMEQAGVRRLICVTGYGAGDSRASIGCLQMLPFRIFLGRAYDDKDVQERLIRDSKLDWTIARPVVLTNGRRSGRYQILVDPKTWRNGLISRADVADFLVRQIEDETYVGTTPVLTY